MRRVLFSILAVTWLALAGCQQSSTESTSTTPAAATPETTPAAEATPPVAEGEKRMLEGGLEVVELAPGTGAVATQGKTVAMHYTGTFTDGTKFDSSLDRGQPLEFVLGTGAVIKGWDQGIEGMKVGEKRRLTIPPALAYGERGYPGAIPPNSTLVFEVELVDVK